MTYDVLIVGGGPAGLSAALALGRARKQVLLVDGGPRRNAAATAIYNFVTRDGTPPDDFRRAGRAELARYPNVTVRDARVSHIAGEKGAFDTTCDGEAVGARRVLLATGMIDERLPIEGFDTLWGRAIFQCPYCHGWEARDERWGFLVLPSSLGHFVPFALQARGWTRDVVVYTNGAFDLPAAAPPQLEAAGVRVQAERIARLVEQDGRLVAVELAGGERVPCDALFTHPPQRQVDLVGALGVALDDDGFVRVDPMRRETSVPGIYAAGDLTTRMQGAILGAAQGTQAAAMINVELTMELALAGRLPI